MRILLFNESSRIAGGTEEVVRIEGALLRKEVFLKEIYYCHDNLFRSGLKNKTEFICTALSLRKKERLLRKAVSQFNPDIIHFHNYYPLFGSVDLDRINAAGAKIILHLHNFYPFCINSFLFNGINCCECLEQNSWLPGIQGKCKDGSFIKSVLFSRRILPAEWLLRSERISGFIAVSEYIKNVYTACGVSPEKIFVVGNPVTPQTDFKRKKRKYVLFVGNIRDEKGIAIFCEAAEKNRGINFIAAGTGKKLKYYRNNYKALSNLKFAGYVSGTRKKMLYEDAAFLMVPSLCPESFSMVTAEAFSYGVPVLTTGAGALSELVKDGETGKVIPAKNIPGAVGEFFEEVKTSSSYFENCRRKIIKFSPEEHLKDLKEVYRKVTKCTDCF